MATPRPPQTLPRPSQDPPKTLPGPKINPNWTPMGPKILQMMPNMTQKWYANGPNNQSKNDQKSFGKPMQNLNASWHRSLIDFNQFGIPRWIQTSTPNRSKSDLGRPWRPQGCPGPSQDPPRTQNRPKTVFSSIQNQFKIDFKPTKNRAHIDNV